MNPSLVKLALLGTDTQSPDFNDRRLDPFVDVFTNSENSAAKNVALAIGVETLIDQATPGKITDNGENLFLLHDGDGGEFLPVDVADAVLAILKTYVSASVSILDAPYETTLFPLDPMFRALARRGLKLPPERAADYLKIIKSEAADNFDPALIAAVAPPNVRDLVTHETSIYAAMWQFPLFLEPYDVPLGVTFEDIEQLFLDEKSSVPLKAQALTAMRALEPARARAALETLVDGASPSGWRSYAKILFSCLATRVDVDDAPLLRATLKKKGVSFESGRKVGELLAGLRDSEYLDSLVKFANSHISSEGGLLRPDVTEKKRLQALGLYTENHLRWSRGDARRRLEEAAEAKLVREFLKRIPLERWEERFQTTPEELLALMAQHERFPIVLAGLRASYMFFKGPRRWEEPLDRPLCAEQSYENDTNWLEWKFRRVERQGTAAIRSLVDQTRSIGVEPKAFPIDLALFLAFHEPYPWRDEFADFFDSVLWKLLENFGVDSSQPTKPVSPSVYSFTIYSNLGVQRDKPFFERLQDRNERVAPVDCSGSDGRGTWNPTTDFARILWDNTTFILHLLPRRLREKYSKLGRLFKERCVDCSSAINGPNYNVTSAFYRKFPFFRYSRLYNSTGFSEAADILENYLFSRSNPE